LVQQVSVPDAVWPANEPELLRLYDQPLQTPTEARSPEGRIRQLYCEASERYAKIDSYIARLRRREQVNGKNKPEELLLFKFRKQPWSVYFKWLGPEGAGREVVYVQGRNGNMIHTLLAAGDMPLAPAGRRMALAPDNIFVRAASRHAITEAGIGTLIDQFGKLVNSTEQDHGPQGTLTYLGVQKRSEFETTVDVVEQVIGPGKEPLLPQGGRRLWMFDPQSKLPAVLITTDQNMHEVEYYCYDRLQYPVHLDDADFDPDRLWPTKR
jgi:hypothetical protein